MTFWLALHFFPTKLYKVKFFYISRCSVLFKFLRILLDLEVVYQGKLNCSSSFDFRPNFTFKIVLSQWWKCRWKFQSMEKSSSIPWCKFDGSFFISRNHLTDCNFKSKGFDDRHADRSIFLLILQPSLSFFGNCDNFDFGIFVH